MLHQCHGGLGKFMEDGVVVVVVVALLLGMVGDPLMSEVCQWYGMGG